MSVDLHKFSDIHSHTRTGPDILTSIPPDFPIDTEPRAAWYSVGVHPWDTTEPVDESTWQALEEKAADARVVAIGECGLDALRGGEQSSQEEVFLRHIELADKVGKPLIIHCVRRYGRLLELRKKHGAGQWIVHGFNGKPELARQLVAAGIGISLGPNVSREKYTGVPDEFIYCETDQ